MPRRNKSLSRSKAGAVDPAFEALAQKLGAVLEPEPTPPLPLPVIKGRGGIPESAIAKLKKIAANRPRTPVNPFGPNVKVLEDEP